MSVSTVVCAAACVKFPSDSAAVTGWLPSPPLLASAPPRLSENSSVHTAAELSTMAAGTLRALQLLGAASAAAAPPAAAAAPPAAAAAAAATPAAAQAGQYVPFNAEQTLVFVEGENFTSSGSWESREWAKTPNYFAIDGEHLPLPAGLPAWPAGSCICGRYKIVVIC